MCEFKSAIVMANGDLLHNPWTDSHEDLVRLFKPNDTATTRDEPRFARVEFKPDEPTDLADISKYKLNIDELRKPEWFDAAMEAKTIEKLKLMVSGMIITGAVDLICGGVFILGKGAKVSSAKAVKIVAMLADSKVGEMWGSSNVGEMWGSSNVGVMWGSSKVGVMRGSSNVGVMWGSSKVGVMRESSNVGEMWGSSNVGEMRESSKVGEMWESSKVGEMRGSSKVGEMRGSSKVGEMRDSSKVGVMRDSSKVGEMRGSSKVDKGTDEKPKA